jgi:hypothetical protein
MELDYTALRFWLMVAQWIVTLGIGIYVWIDRRSSDSQEQINALRTANGALEKTVIRLEGEVRSLPARTELAEIHGRITDVSLSQQSMQGQLQQMNSTLGMIQEYLLHRGGHS